MNYSSSTVATMSSIILYTVFNTSTTTVTNGGTSGGTTLANTTTASPSFTNNHDHLDPFHIHDHHVDIGFEFLMQEIVLGFIALFGIIGNILVCYTVCKQNQIKHTTWHYLCSLSITDLLVSVINVPLFMYTTYDETIIDTDKFMCQFNGFLLVCFFLISVITLAMISVHKYLYINYPLYWRGSNQSLKFVAAIWFTCVCIAVGPFLGWSSYSHVHGRKQCIPAAYQTTIDRSYLLVLVSVGFILPLASMIFCYSFIFMSTRKHQKRVLRNSIGSIETRGLREWGIIKTIIIVVFTFCVCWTPFVVYICFSYMTVDIPMQLSQAAFILAYMQSALNPIIYALRHKLFRDHFKSVICCSKYANLYIPEQSSTQTGTAFTVENRSAKLVHYKKKYSTVSNFQGITSVNIKGSPSGDAFFEKAVIKDTPMSYYNEIFRMSNQ